MANYRSHRRRRSFRKKRPVKRTSTRQLAKKNHRMLSKIEEEQEHKWIVNWFTAIRVPSALTPNANNAGPYGEWTTQLCTGIPALANSTLNGGLINSANQRIGQRIYLSAIYARVEFYFKKPAAGQHYPPYCDCHAILVREKVNNTQVEATLPGTVGNANVPTTLELFDTSNLVGSVATPADERVDLGNTLFRSMNNGDNLYIAGRKSVRLTTQPLVDVTRAAYAAGAAVPAIVSALAYDLVAGARKGVDITYHPKCCAEYVTPSNLDHTAGQFLGLDQLVAKKNGCYLLAYCVMPQQEPGGVAWTAPQMSGQIKTRFTDS